ncbi:MAG: hypothetical protein ACM3JG_16000 [Thiohalocapsa sp.]
MTSLASRPKKILAVASSGGHWLQLLRLRPAFAGHHVVYVTTQADDSLLVPARDIRVVPDASRRSKGRMLLLLVRMLAIVLRERPDVVISTGAAPGYFAIRFGRYIGARTLWLDSIANVEKCSLAGMLARPYADLMLTQWPHLAQPQGPSYRGRVL